MKNYLLPLFLVLLLAFSGTAAASPAEETEFYLVKGEVFDEGVSTYDYDNMVLHVKGMEVKGNVAGDLRGKFHYVENVTVDLTTLQSTNQGFMTMTNIAGCQGQSEGKGKGTIEIRFVGRSKFNPLTGFWDVDDQPFTILKGTDGCARIHGNGTRSAQVPADGSWSTVTYTGQVHWDPQ